MRTITEEEKKLIRCIRSEMRPHEKEDVEDVLFYWDFLNDQMMQEEHEEYKNNIIRAYLHLWTLYDGWEYPSLEVLDYMIFSKYPKQRRLFAEWREPLINEDNVADLANKLFYDHIEVSQTNQSM